MGTPPTIVEIDSFHHKVAAQAQAGSGWIGTYDAISTGAGATNAFDSTVARTSRHSGSWKLIPLSASATRNSRNIASGNRLTVHSFYFKTSAGATGHALNLFQVVCSTNANINLATDGTLVATLSGGSTGTSASVADGNWHRIDFRFDSSGTTFTIDWRLDGVAQTQASRTGRTAADQTSYAFGCSNNVSGDSYTVNLSDYCQSHTTGDYPIGEHICLPLVPTGEGTDNLNAHIVDNGGGTSNLYQAVDDWLGTGTADTSTYVTQSATGTTEYAEFTLADPAATVATVWGVGGVTGGFANNATVNTTLTVKTQVVDSGGSNIDTIDSAIDYSGSTSVLGYYRKFLAAPGGGWTRTNLAGAKIRWGYATIDSGHQPRLSAAMLEWVGPDAKTVTHTVDAVISLTSTKTHTADAVILKTATVTHTVDAEIKASELRTHTADAVIRKSAAVTHTADALVLKSATPTHTVTAVIKSSLTLTHTADGTIVKTSTVTHTADADIFKTSTLTHTADAFLLNIGAVSHTVDAVIRATPELTHTADALVVLRDAVPHTVDAIIVPSDLQHGREHTVDALISVTGTRTHTATALIRATPTLTHTVDAHIRKLGVVQHTVDALVFGTQTLEHTATALIIQSTVLRHTVTAEIVDRTAISHSVDALVLAACDDGGAFTALLTDWIIVYNVQQTTESDVYGNPIEDPSAGCFVRARVDPLTQREDITFRQTRLTQYTVFVGPDVDVNAIDTIQWQGRMHQVIGRPPIFTGRSVPHHQELVMELVEA